MLRVAEHFSGSDVGRQRQGNEDSYFVAHARCSWSPTGWAARRPARSPRGSRSRRSRDGLPGGAAAPRSSPSVDRGGQRAHPRDVARPTSAAPAWARPDGGLRRRGRGRRSPTSATRAPTCCATASSTRLTRDHSLVERARRPRQADRGGGRDPPAALVITRAVGPEADVEVDTRRYRGARRRRLPALLATA